MNKDLLDTKYKDKLEPSYKVITYILSDEIILLCVLTRQSAITFVLAHGHVFKFEERLASSLCIKCKCFCLMDCYQQTGTYS